MFKKLLIIAALVWIVSIPFVTTRAKDVEFALIPAGSCLCGRGPDFSPEVGAPWTQLVVLEVTSGVYSSVQGFEIRERPQFEGTVQMRNYRRAWMANWR